VIDIRRVHLVFLSNFDECLAQFFFVFDRRALTDDMVTSSLPVDSNINVTGRLMPPFRHDGRLSDAEHTPANAAMYYDIIAPRPRWPIISPPPQLSVIKRIGYVF
jgi:hypothetical protein